MKAPTLCGYILGIVNVIWSNIQGVASKKQKNHLKISFHKRKVKSKKKKHSFLLGQNMSAHKKSDSWVSPKWAKSNERKERRKKGRRQKSVKTMASLAFYDKEIL